MNLQLIRAGLPPINIKFADKKRYYDAFDAYASTHSAKEMTMLIANYLIERMQTMINTITL